MSHEEFNILYYNIKGSDPIVTYSIDKYYDIFLTFDTDFVTTNIKALNNNISDHKQLYYKFVI
jgi:hypothetical protein